MKLSSEYLDRHRNGNLIKKAHTSRFCLDYLHLMRTLFKNILFNCNRENASPLFS